MENLLVQGKLLRLDPTKRSLCWVVRKGEKESVAGSILLSNIPRWFEKMKRVSIAIFAAVLFVGCSTLVTVKVTYAPTGKPADGVLVQRRRPVNMWEKITNPVGATYHPYREVETHWTDAAGECTLNRIGSRDIIDFFITSNVPLNVVAGNNQIELMPGPNQSFLTYAYHVWVEDGQVKFTVTESSGNWNNVNERGVYF